MSPAATAAARPRAGAASPARPGHAPTLDRWSEAGRARLRLVATRPLTVGRLPFALLVGGILATGLVALLLLHTLAAQDAFRLQDLQRQHAELADVEQELALAEQQRQAPSALAARARALGMVPTGSIAFVRPGKHGKIVGVVHPAVAPAPVAPAPTPEPSEQAREKPRDTKPSHRGDTADHHRRVSPKPGG
jgi:hypothetical protein